MNGFLGGVFPSRCSSSFLALLGIINALADIAYSSAALDAMSQRYDNFQEAPFGGILLQQTVLRPRHVNDDFSQLGGRLASAYIFHVFLPAFVIVTVFPQTDGFIAHFGHLCLPGFSGTLWHIAGLGYGNRMHFRHLSVCIAIDVDDLYGLFRGWSYRRGAVLHFDVHDNPAFHLFHFNNLLEFCSCLYLFCSRM